MAQSAAMIPAGLLVLRAGVALVLVAHASHWLFGSFAGPGMGPGGLTSASVYFASAGVGPAFTFVMVSGILQFAGGILLLAGWFTRIACGILIAVELAKLSFDSARWGFFLNWTLDPTRGHGMEFAFLIMIALGCLALTGAGDWSADGVRARSSAALAAGRARIRERG